MNEDSKSAFERHAQTTLVFLAVSLLGWVGVSVDSSGKEIVRLQEQVTALSQRLDSVAGLPDRVSRLEVRVSQLETAKGSSQ